MIHQSHVYRLTFIAADGQFLMAIHHVFSTIFVSSHPERLRSDGGPDASPGSLAPSSVPFDHVAHTNRAAIVV
jgi:hypothetical protein